MGKRIFIILIQSLLLLSSAIFLTLICQPLFVFQVQFIDTQLLLGLTHEQVIMNYNILLQYLLNPFEQVLVMPDIVTSVQGAWHFHEVKQLFLLNHCVLILTAIIQFKWLTIKRIEKEILFLLDWYTRIKWVPLISAILIAVMFNTAFTFFHQVLFRNDAWVFNPVKDPIILALPESFFLACFIIVIVIIQLGHFMFYQLYYSVVYNSKK